MNLIDRLLAVDRVLMRKLTLARRHELPPRLAHPAKARVAVWIATFLAHSGDSVIWLLIGSAALLWGAPGWRRAGIRILLGNLGGGQVTGVLKFLVRRQRPSAQDRALYHAHDRHSFPSGHAGRFACSVTLVWAMLPLWSRPLVLLWGLAIGWARVGLQAHYVSDVLAGWLVGWLAGLLADEAARIAF